MKIYKSPSQRDFFGPDQKTNTMTDDIHTIARDTPSESLTKTEWNNRVRALVLIAQPEFDRFASAIDGRRGRGDFSETAAQAFALLMEEVSLESIARGLRDWLAKNPKTFISDNADPDEDQRYSRAI